MATAVLKRVDDPRNSLEKARRFDLVRFARENGLSQIDENWPADVIRRHLIKAGLTRIQVNAPMLGAMPGAGVAVSDEPVRELDAGDELERQFMQQMQAAKPVSTGINSLRAECKRLGIKLSRQDSMATMKQKIADHGKQDPA